MPENKRSQLDSNLRMGAIYGIVAQVIWGLFPLYVNLLRPTPAINIVAHRVVWAFALLVLLVIAGRWFRLPAVPAWSEIRQVFRKPRTLRWLFFAAFLILWNWLGFVAAVALNRTMDVSVGYYICPQVVVLLGVIFQKERLSTSQWFAFACSSLGVLVMAASTAGIPWLGLLVAFSFGFYALSKKRIDCSALTSLTFETGILFLPAAALLLYRVAWVEPVSISTDGALVSPVVSPLVLNGLLMFTGVITVLPLALYVDSIRRIPLSIVGLLQFIGPTIQLLLSIFVLGDPFDWARGIGIILIWAGVILYLLAMRSNR